MRQIAFITGANKGIGYETARILAERGMTVLIGARDEAKGHEAERTLRKRGADVRFVPIDVTDDTSIKRAAAWVKSEYGHIDVLVNNAGIAGGSANTLPSGTTRADLRLLYETNVFAVVAVTNAFLPLLRESGSARIVNVSSEVGSLTKASDPQSPLFQLGELAYAASKASVNMVTVMYAKELRSTGIKVNASVPGYCATDLNDNTGFRTATQGASVSVALATLPDDGPTGTVWGYLTGNEQDVNQAMPW